MRYKVNSITRDPTMTTELPNDVDL